MGLLKKIKKAGKKLSLKNISKSAKDTVKNPLKAIKTGITKTVGSTIDVATLGAVDGSKAMDNVRKKGLGALTMGQITGTDRAKLLANREVAAAEAATAANPDDPAGVGADLDPIAMANADDIEIRKARRKAMIAAQRRGGRQSTMISDKSEF